MGYKNKPWVDPSYLRDLTCVTNIDRTLAGGNLSALTTQKMLVLAVPLQAGDVVTTISFVSGGTAADTPTNWWFALYDRDVSLMAQTADQTNTAWAANTRKALALATPQLIETAGIYYVGIMVKATAVPTLRGVSLGDTAISSHTGMYKMSMEDDGPYTDTAPAAYTEDSASFNVPFVVLT